MRPMRPMLLVVAVLAIVAASLGSATALHARSAARPVDPVIQWNRTLLQILRTPGAQPKTVHPTRSLAIMHVAIYDAVDAIDQTHAPYLGGTVAPRHASEPAAADAAAHDTLVGLYPALKGMLDALGKMHGLLALGMGRHGRPAGGDPFELMPSAAAIDRHFKGTLVSSVTRTGSVLHLQMSSR